MSQWVAVIPVKRLTVAKSRLRGAVDDTRHGELALAMLRDTLSAVLACSQIAEAVVVTDDPVVTTAARALGARTVPDAPPDYPATASPDAAVGLNAAVGFGADVAAGLHRWRAVLTGDLPGLRPAELAEVLLAAAAPVRHFLPDAAGTGTVLLTAPPGVLLDPHFGTDSAAAHAASGAVRLTGAWPALRRDVDTPDDLRAVLSLGAGAHTSAMLADGTPGGERGLPHGPRLPEVRSGRVDEQSWTGRGTRAGCGGV